MNIIGAYNITRPLGVPAIDYAAAESIITDAIMDKDPHAGVERLGLAIGTGKDIFTKTNDLRTAIDAAVKVMETH